MKNLLFITLFFFSFQAIGQIELVEDKIVLTNEAKINSRHLEYSPAFYKNGIVFITTRPKGVGFQQKDQNIGTNIMSIYESKRDTEGFLETPQPFANELIAKLLHEGPLTFNAIGNELFFTRNAKKEAADGKKKLQIYSAELYGSEWKKVTKLPFNTNEHNFSHPSISVDGDVLYFSSNMPGGYGGMDLYKVEKIDTTWGSPKNLGPEINTTANEIFPFFHADGTLYFASNGHGGLGGLDIFYTSMEEEKWGNPINLELPFNSNLDDFGFIVDLENKNGYFSSNRKTGSGKDDIYSFYLLGERDVVDATGKKRKKQNATFNIKDEAGNNIEKATISYVSMDDLALTNGKENAVRIRPIGENEFALSLDIDKMGEKRFSNTDGTKDVTFKEGNYIFTIAKEGYVPQQIIVTPKTDLKDLTVTLQKMADCIPLTGEVLTSAKMVKQSGAEVQIVDTETEETTTIYTDANGVFKHCLPCNRSFSLFANKNGVNSEPIYLFTKNMNCNEGEELSTKLYLNAPSFAIEEGARIRLPNIYFNFNDAALRPDAKKDLEAIEVLLKTYPDIQIELASHTDARGSSAYNLELSKERSRNIYNYLIIKEIDGNQMVVKGYGESQIRNRCANGVRCSESEQQYNRRTEIVVLSTGNSNQLSKENEDPDGLFIISDNLETTETKAPQTKTEEIPKTFVNQSPTESITNITPPLKEDNEGFLVIAGTFEIFENALNREQTLKNAGFKEVKILEFNAQNLHAVCVQTTNSALTANALVEQLERHHGINAYVKESNK